MKKSQQQLKHPSKKPKVLFLCKKRHDLYGISVGLINSATFVSNVLNCHGIESKVAIVFDGNGIDREVYHYKPTHVIIEALWVTPDKMEVLIKRYPKLQWIVRVHSKASFIANEGIAMSWLADYVYKLTTKYPNIFISANNKDFNQELCEVLKTKSIYLPNIYDPKDTPCSPHKVANDVIDIGCFGAIRPLKNNLEQGISAIRFGNDIGKKIRFHVNAGRLEQNGDTVLRNLRAIFKYSHHELVEHKWLTHKDFTKLVRTMDMGMQVSLSESFNIVAADLVMNDIPVVVSDEINWIPLPFQADPKDGNDIVNTLKMVYRLRKTRIHFINKLFLKWSNFWATKA